MGADRSARMALRSASALTSSLRFVNEPAAVHSSETQDRVRVVGNDDRKLPGALCLAQGARSPHPSQFLALGVVMDHGGTQYSEAFTKLFHVRFPHLTAGVVPGFKVRDRGSINGLDVRRRGHGDRSLGSEIETRVLKIRKDRFGIKG